MITIWGEKKLGLLGLPQDSRKADSGGSYDFSRLRLGRPVNQMLHVVLPCEGRRADTRSRAIVSTLL